MLARFRKSVDRYQRRHIWVGFPYAVLKKFGEDKSGQLAALVAYYGFFSLFPLLLVLITLLAIVLRSNPELQNRVLDTAVSQFPIIGDQIRQNISGIARSGVALIIGLASALWAGLAGIKAMQNALDHIWDVPVRRHPPIWVQLLRGIVMLLVLGAFVFVATGLAGVGTEGESVSLIARLFTFPLSLFVNVIVFLLAFKLLTVAEIGWRDVLPGAVIAGLAWAGLQAIGNYYVGNQLKNASEMYGLFGLVIGLLSWLYLASQVTLLAAEVNVVRTRKLWPRSLGNKPETAADRRALAAHAEVEERVEGEEVGVRFEKRSPRKRKGKARVGGSRRG